MIMIRTAMKCVVVAGLFGAAPPALAHVSLETKEAKTGAAYKAALRVPHGCEGSATVSISVAIPEGLIGVKPMPKPGWTITMEHGPYARAYQHYHGDLNEGVRRMTWTGGPLPDDYFDEFVFSGFVAREIEGMERLVFPVRQTCEQGVIDWVEVAQDSKDTHDLEFPAATLRIAATKKTDDHAAQAPSPISAGDLVVEQVWARATPPGAETGAGYVRITNKGSTPDRLVGATLEGAGRVEMHETLSEGGVMRMREREGGIEIVPGATIAFEPGGLHLMFLELSGALTEGGTAKGSLEFEKAGKVEIEFPIRRGPADASHDHHH